MLKNSGCTFGNSIDSTSVERKIKCWTFLLLNVVIRFPESIQCVQNPGFEKYFVILVFKEDHLEVQLKYPIIGNGYPPHIKFTQIRATLSVHLLCFLDCWGTGVVHVLQGWAGNRTFENPSVELTLKQAKSQATLFFLTLRVKSWISNVCLQPSKKKWISWVIARGFHTSTLACATLYI